MEKWERWESDWSQEYIDGVWESYLRRRTWETSPRFKFPAEFAHVNAKSVLDIGCGGGILYKAISELDKSIYYEGIDITPKMIKCARRLFPGIAFEVRDAVDLPYNDDCFDLCVVSHVLEHQPPERAKKIISEAMRVAKKAVITVFFIAPSHEISEAVKVGYDRDGFYENIYSHDWLVKIIHSIDRNCKIKQKRFTQEKEDNTFYIITL